MSRWTRQLLTAVGSVAGTSIRQKKADGSAANASTEFCCMKYCVGITGKVMSFFDLLNAPAALKPTYMKGSELPLFVPLKIEKVEPAVTIIGPTTKIEAVMGNMQVFFYLNEEDHKKMIENDGVNQLMSLVNAHQNPFCFSVKSRKSLGVRFLPFDAEILVRARDKLKLKLSQLPQVVLNEIDVAGLAEMGITFEP